MPSLSLRDIAVPLAQADAILPSQILIAPNVVVTLGTQNSADRMCLIKSMFQQEPPTEIE